LNKSLTAIKIDSNILELKFQGNDIKPNKVSIKELTNILSNFDEAFKAMILHYDPTIDLDDDYISLIAIDNKSLSLKSELKKFIEVSKTAYLALALAISSGDINALPEKAKKPIHNISNFNKKWDCEAKFGYSKNNIFNEIASFKSLNQDKDYTFQQKSTYYGELKKIGGDNPVANVLSLNGRYINAHLSKEQVIEYSNLVYKDVKIVGSAKYSGKTLRLKSFFLESMEAYEILSINQTVDSFKKLINTNAQ